MIRRAVKRFFNIIFPHLKCEGDSTEKEEVLKEISAFKENKSKDNEEIIVKTYAGAKRGRKPGTKNKVKSTKVVKNAKK